MFLAVPLAGAFPSPTEIRWSHTIGPFWLWCVGAAVFLGAILGLILLRRRKFVFASWLCLMLAGADTTLWAWSLRAGTAFEVGHVTYYSEPVRLRDTALGLTSECGGVGLRYFDDDHLLGFPQSSPAAGTTLYATHSPYSHSNYPQSGWDFPFDFNDQWPWLQLGINGGCGASSRAPDGTFTAAAGLTLPHWLVVSVLLLTPSVWGVGSFRRIRRRRYRATHNLCLACGYDLRAHQTGAAGAKCPECGTAVKS